ncbi:MAG: archaeosine biosynthesis radical SAM protein RaSEA [Candidatus Thermoplasmatota archaeon]|nr:archaeosine biosynthesis radical SAM protein RaSEA [Candidatus Thermoplasmatota archaeon]
MESKGEGHGHRRHERKRDLDRPASAWREKELIDGRLVDVGVLILQTSGCSHYHEGGCSMCGYNYGPRLDVPPSSILRQFENGLGDLGEIRFLKIYTSGSFLDEDEVDPEVSDTILRTCKDLGLRLLFETRPEYVTPARIGRVQFLHDDVEVALGLESANDKVLECSINKGFSVKDYDRAAEILREREMDIRTYVLLKPPFLTETEAIRDSVATMAHAAEVSAALSLNPVNVQKGTLVEKLWRSWSYRPPWLWSVLEVLRSCEGLGVKVVCDPTGGGKERGAHNCGKCDDVILDSIRGFSQSQDYSRLGAPECGCKAIWESVVDLEPFVAGGCADLQRFFRRQRA